MLKSGFKKDNYNRLVDHWIGHHLDEYNRMNEWLDYSCPGTSTHSYQNVTLDYIPDYMM